VRERTAVNSASEELAANRNKLPLQAVWGNSAPDRKGLVDTGSAASEGAEAWESLRQVQTMGRQHG